MKSLLRLLALGAMVFATPAVAQTYPDRPVRVVVPYAAGGPADILARLVASKLGDYFGQQFFVENRPGAGGGIGTVQVARSPADGYTLLVAPVGVMSINPWIYKSLPYDPIRDLQPITLLAKSPFLLAVNPKLPIQSVKEFVAYAKANPGKVRIANPGVGTGQHLSAVYFSSVTAVDTVQVPYRGSAPGTTDVLGGSVEAQFDLAPLMPHIKAGTLRAIATTASKRMELLPEVPTIAESGYPGFEMEAWNGLVAPVGTPRAIVDKIQQGVARALSETDVKETLLALGYEAGGQTADEFGKFVRTELEKYKKVAKDANVPTIE